MAHYDALERRIKALGLPRTRQVAMELTLGYDRTMADWNAEDEEELPPDLRATAPSPADGSPQPA